MKLTSNSGVGRGGSPFLCPKPYRGGNSVGSGNELGAHVKSISRKSPGAKGKKGIYVTEKFRGKFASRSNLLLKGKKWSHSNSEEQEKKKRKREKGGRSGVPSQGSAI